MTTTPNLNLPYLASDQAQKHVTHNEALLALDALVQLAVIEQNLSTPPASPTEGDKYIIAASPTGAWSGKAGQIAIWQGAIWIFYPPRHGWLAWDENENLAFVFDGSVWIKYPSSFNQLAQIGINTSADSTNKLAVKSDSVLYSHDDITPGSGDIRTTVNKSSETDTASFVFKNNWSGRAEFGLAGDDHFRIKVSPDGSSWSDGLKIDNDNGHVSAPLLSSGQVTITDDTIAEIPTPGTGGFVLITIVSSTGYPQGPHSGILTYDTGVSPLLTSLALASNMENQGITTLTGTVSTDGNTGIAVKADTLVIENRGGATRIYSYTFIGGHMN